MEVVFRHLLQSVEPGKGKGHLRAFLNVRTHDGKKVRGDAALPHQGFQVLELVQGHDETPFAQISDDLLQVALERPVGVDVEHRRFRRGDADCIRDGVAYGQEDVADAVGGCAHALDVQVGHPGRRPHPLLHVAQDGGLAHTSVAVEDDRLQVPAHDPKFLQAAQDVLPAHEEGAEHRVSNNVRVLHRFNDFDGAHLTGQVEEQTLPTASNLDNEVTFCFRQPAFRFQHGLDFADHAVEREGTSRAGGTAQDHARVLCDSAKAGQCFPRSWVEEVPCRGGGHNKVGNVIEGVGGTHGHQRLGQPVHLLAVAQVAHARKGFSGLLGFLYTQIPEPGRSGPVRFVHPRRIVPAGPDTSPPATG